MRRGYFLISPGFTEAFGEGKPRVRYLEAVGSFIKFSQDNRLMRRGLLKKNQKATDSTYVVGPDMTDKGRRFFRAAYEKWQDAVMKGKVKAEDTGFLAEALAQLPPWKRKVEGQTGGIKRKVAKKRQQKKTRRAPVRAGRRGRQGVSAGSLTPGEVVDDEALNPHVYDKADYHTEGEFPEDLPEFQAFVHTGMFVGWLIEHDMIDGEFRDFTAGFKRRQRTGAQIFENMGGVLLDEMLTPEGNAFARDYFEFETGEFVYDYEKLLAKKLPSTYHVEDTWKNYEVIRRKIEQRYKAWKRRRKKG